MIKKLSIKIIITSVILLATYVLGIHSLFVQVSLLSAMAYMLVFFIALHFFYIEIYHHPEHYFAIIVISLGLIVSALFGHNSIQIILSIITLHLWIIIFAHYLRSELGNTLRFNALTYFAAGGYMFTVFITIGFGLALIWYYNSFPFTCQWLDAASSSVVDTVTKPLKLWLQEVSSLKNQAKIFFASKITDAFQLQQQLSTTPNPGALWWASQQLITQAREENVSTSMGICDYLLAKVNDKFGKPEFRSSLTVLLFLLLYPFIRIVFWVMSLIGYIVFKILFLSKVYTVSTIQKDIQEID